MVTNKRRFPYRKKAPGQPQVRKKKPTPESVDEIEESEYEESGQSKKVRWEGNGSIEEEENTTEAKESDGTDDQSAPPEKICLTASCIRGRTGFAYYDPVKYTLYVHEDTQETPHFDLTRMILDQASPDVVLTSSKADDEFIDTLRDYVETSGGIIQIRPHKDFVPGKGRDRLASLQLLSVLPTEEVNDYNSSDVGSDDSRARNADEFMRRRREAEGGDPTMKRWNAGIRLSNFTSVELAPLCVSSIGALLDYLVRERAINDLEDEGVRGLDIRTIESLALNEVMQINTDALFSLQIFENETHASVHSDKIKEGLSLFGILNTTKTTLGRALMRTWLLRPSLSLAVIKARHDAVDCFIASENLVTVGALHVHLKGIKNVPRILAMSKTGRAKIADWQGLVKFTFHCAMLKDALAELNQIVDVEIVQKVVAALDISTFRDMGNRINEIIDWEESAEAGRVSVRVNVDEDLDNRKHVYYGIDSVLSKVAEQIGETIPVDFTTSLNIVYFPQLGFLICIPMQDDWEGEEGIRVIDGWSFQFSSESHVYFKSQEMQDMDTHIGDLHSLIVDREIEIIQALLEEILVHEKSISEVCDVCAELDCLLAFADAARGYEYRRPIMVDQNVIDITQGRHPLQELVVDTFVPNDARLAGSGDSEEEKRNKVVLCTGANACGKSVYLKQIALIQYMAQVGCFVPAEAATLGIVDKIFTRISTRESVSKAQSVCFPARHLSLSQCWDLSQAFMIDLNQVSLALRNSTSRSLVLLDEFGKGTLSTGSCPFLLPSSVCLGVQLTLVSLTSLIFSSKSRFRIDGAGLLCGVLKHLLERGPNCPMVLAATHFHDVFREDLLDPDSVSISFLHMQVMFTGADGNLLETTMDDSSRAGTPSDKKLVGPLEKITYLYRVAAGLTLDSHAAKCAEIFGVPANVVHRALHVSHLISTHEIGQLLDEEMTEQERIDLAAAETVCRKFLAWNLEDGQGRVKERLAEVLGRTLEDEDGNQY
ncbi:DNA mismatch repair protein MutS [Mycena floridula]|nr:DNA mismatch repair protein MutS [Mycena floridula]